MAYEKSQDKKNSDFEDKIKELSKTNKILEEKIKKLEKENKELKEWKRKKKKNNHIKKMKKGEKKKITTKLLYFNKLDSKLIQKREEFNLLFRKLKKY